MQIRRKGERQNPNEDQPKKEDMKKGIKIAMIAACCVIVALVITFIVLWKQFEAGIPTVENQVTPTGIVSVTPDNPTSVPTSAPETPTKAPTTAPTGEPDVTDAPIVEPTDAPVITDTPAEPTDTPLKPTAAPTVTDTPDSDEAEITEAPQVTEAPLPTETPAVTVAPTATPTPSPTPTVTPTPVPKRTYKKEIQMGDNVWYRLTEDNVLYVTGTGATWGYDLYTDEDGYLRGDYSGIYALLKINEAEHLVIEEGITKLGKYSLMRLEALESLTFPSTLTEIGDCCFLGTATTENAVWKGLDLDKVKLGDRAFYGTVYQTEEDLKKPEPTASPTPTPITEPMTANSFYKTLVEEAGISVDMSKSEPYSAALVSKGILASTDVKSANETFSNQEVAKILYDTATVLGIESDSEKVANAKKYNRISDNGGIVPGYEEAVYFCFTNGIMPGVSDGEYSHTRSFEPKKSAREADCVTYCKRLFNESIRTPMSPDAQVLRTTNLPVQAKLYPYILESFPNVYYDANYHYMYNLDTDDRAFSDIAYDVGFLEWWCTPNTFKEFAEKQPERCMWFSSPTDYLGYEMVSAAFLAERYGEQWEKDAKRYLELILNFDYRTVREDVAWQEEIKNLNAFYTEWGEGRLDGSDTGVRGIDTWMENFLDCAEENHTVVQCSDIDFDMSALWYSEQFSEDAPFTVRVHLRYKIDTDMETDLYIGWREMVLPTVFQGVNTRFESFGEWKDVYAEIAFGVNSFDQTGVAGLRIGEDNEKDPTRYHFDPKKYVD